MAQTTRLEEQEIEMGSFRNTKKVVMVAAVLLVLTLSLGGGVASKSNDQAATYENLRLFTEVLSIIQSQYVDEVPPKELIYSAIKGTLRGLDPHSSFLDPEMYKEMQVETSGSFGGLGIEITLRDDILTVVTPIEGTPAYRAGILPGDRIVKIEGISTKDMQLADAVKKMRGKPGSKIVISVVREGWQEPKDFTITREQIRVQSVKSGSRASSTSACASSRNRRATTSRPLWRSTTRTSPSRVSCSTCATTRADCLPPPWRWRRSSSSQGSWSSTRRGACGTRTCASRPAASIPTRISRSSFS